MKHLERALLFTLLAHLLACAAMGLLLLPGMPGGPNADALARAAFIANHGVSWRVGFFFWHLVSLSDLLLSLALLGAAWKTCRGPALAGLLLTGVALAIEQPCEILWETRMVDLAREAAATGNADRFLALETPLYLWLAAASTLAWTATAACWSLTLARLKVWTRGLTPWSWILWSLFALISLAPLAPHAPWLDAAVMAGNMLGFALMMGWFVWITALAWKRNRLHIPENP